MHVLKIYGAPGCGKTRFLLDAFSASIKAGTAPDRIAFLTFTRSAREEAASRVQRPLKEIPWLRTIHSACFKALGMTREEIVTPDSLREFGKSVGADVTGRTRNPWSEDERGSDTGRLSSDDVILQVWHLARHRCVGFEGLLPESMGERYARWLIGSYENWKANEGLLDYTDLIEAYVKRQNALPVDELIVDEAQDLSLLQWKAVRVAAWKASRLTVAGDDDQAIFSWAGASAHEFIAAESDETVVLPRSYRLPRSVYRLSQRIIGRIMTRKPKEFTPRAAEGKVFGCGFDIRAENLSGDALVLFRNNFRERVLAESLEGAAVPFSGRLAPLGRPDVAGPIASWLKLASGGTVNAESANELSRAMSLEWRRAARRVTGDVDWRVMSLLEPSAGNLAEALSRLPHHAYVSAVLRKHGVGALLDPNVKLLSIHRSKGREADTVVLDPTLARRSAEEAWSCSGDEHRVWYVAVTRARRRLVVLAASGASYPVLE